MNMITLLTRKKYAEKHNLSEEAIRIACQKGTLSKVEFQYEGKDGQTYKGKFILPKEYVIVDRSRLMEAAKGIKTD